MTEIERIFRRDFLFSKEDLLQSLELQMEYIEHDPETGYTKSLIKNKLALYGKFYQRIEKSIFPVLTDLYWHYDYNYTGTGMELWLCNGEDVELSEDEDGISSMSISSEQLLMSVECEYVPPEEFAAIQEVSPSTVNQWLKKGKLRYAKYIEGKWMIPSTAEKPDRDYGFVQYTFNTDDPPVIEEFPIIAAGDSLVLRKDERRFLCSVNNYKTNFHQIMELSREEIERLEYALIKSSKAVAGMPAQCVICLRRE